MAIIPIPWPGCLLPHRDEQYVNEFIEMIIELDETITPEQAAEMRAEAQEMWDLTPGVRVRTKYGMPQVIFKTFEDAEEHYADHD